MAEFTLEILAAIKKYCFNLMVIVTLTLEMLALALLLPLTHFMLKGRLPAMWRGLSQLEEML